MALIAALDELIISADVALAVHVQSAPLALLIAIGAVVIGAMAMGSVLGAIVAVVLRLVRDLGQSEPSSKARELGMLRISPRIRRRPVGARGARAPGRRTPRPVPQA